MRALVAHRQAAEAARLSPRRRPDGFLVCSHGTLLEGQASWGRRWGMTIAAASKTYLPAPA